MAQALRFALAEEDYEIVDIRIEAGHRTEVLKKRLALEKQEDGKH